jgi:thiol-disulfide isomerase/thioredoxin
VLALAVVVGIAALREPSTVTFEASGPPLPLPAEGQFPAVTQQEFEGILVGQLGTPVIVNVWASWCAPCRTEMPLLQRAAETYGDQVVILGVASNDSPEAARKFLDEFGSPTRTSSTFRVRRSWGHRTDHLLGPRSSASH